MRTTHERQAMAAKLGLGRPPWQDSEFDPDTYMGPDWRPQDIPRQISPRLVANLFAASLQGRNCPWGAMKIKGTKWFAAREKVGRNSVPWGQHFRPLKDSDGNWYISLRVPEEGKNIIMKAGVVQ